jgi:hypothetical protein
MVFNGVVGGHVLIASGSNAYNFVLATNTFSQVLTGTCTQIGYCDGFFFAFNKATGRTQLSALNDGTTWPGNLFQRSKFADPAQAVFVDENGLIWTSARRPSRSATTAASARSRSFRSPAWSGRTASRRRSRSRSCAGSPYWLAQTKEGVGDVVRGASGGAEVVSNYAMANLISTYARTSRIDDAEMRGIRTTATRSLNRHVSVGAVDAESRRRDEGLGIAAAAGIRCRRFDSGRRARTRTRSASTSSPIGRPARSRRWTLARDGDRWHRHRQGARRAGDLRRRPRVPHDSARADRRRRRRPRRR